MESGRGFQATVARGRSPILSAENQHDAGKRLALGALGTTYGKQLVYSGAVYKSMSAQDGKITIKFEHAGEGLKAAHDKLKGFAIAGADRKFVFAEAQIAGPDTVVVSSSEVAQPAAVRYAWAANPDANLVNSASLPASPFRTDKWDSP